MIKKIYNSIRRIPKLFKIIVLKDKFLMSHEQWMGDKGDDKLRYNYDLNSESIVFDLGGYHGEFAEKIYNKYQCSIYVFEPVKEHFNIITSKFSGNSMVKVYNFGLSDKDEMIDISIEDNGSSIYLTEGKKERISLKSAANFIKDEGLTSIDLLKSNIEGGEFPVLQDLIKANLVQNIKNIQVQFHSFIPNSIKMREDIHIELNKTHHTTYNYYFVWENWELDR